MIVCRRTGNLTHLVRWGLLFAGLGCSAQAQTAQLQPVTIQQAVAEAVEKNLNVLAEKYSIPIAEARIVTARLRPNPVLSVGGRSPGSTRDRLQHGKRRGPRRVQHSHGFCFRTGSETSAPHRCSSGRRLDGAAPIPQYGPLGRARRAVGVCGIAASEGRPCPGRRNTGSVPPDRPGQHEPSSQRRSGRGGIDPHASGRAAV